MAVVLVIEMTLRFGWGNRKDPQERGTDEACSESPLHTHTLFSRFSSLSGTLVLLFFVALGQGPFVSREIGVVSRGW